jgi:heat shock protein HslJ
MSRTRLALTSLGLAVVLSACAAVPPVAESSAADPPRLDGTAWVLAELPGHARVPGSSITLRFEDGRASGSDGCNRYGFAYTGTGSRLEFTPSGISTQMACAPELMQQATAFKASLTRTTAFGMDSGQLQLLGANGAVLARFAAQPEGLAGTAWLVTGYNNGRQAVVSVLNDTELTMEFSTDGKVAGSAGCNRYTGSFEQDGKALSFGPTATTRRMCAGPEGVMEQEQQFLKALESVATARLEADRLELRTADGALAVTLHGAPTR